MSKMVYLGSNLKMYKGVKDTVEFLTRLSDLTKDIDRSGLTLFIIPSYVTLESARKAVPNASILLGAQNMHWEEEGQFTGEISPRMLQEIGIDIIEIGHSERRHVMGENDFDENKKVLSALNHGFKALLCVGETLQQKELDLSDETLSTQLKIGLSGVDKKDIGRLWIAYEPVWAIGVNGIPASKEYADEKHAVIKDVLCGLFGSDADGIPVLYGGSVNPQNAEELAEMPNIDGLFIGRSAWDAEGFNKIIRATYPIFQKKP
ncbi:triose-phosphate isomerase [Christensenellaceae bacterium OttesenSCG-928-K19]|nr:triose-phosphate isomerase [Christensenellaceae bacterium OttesenSCG-928-K19]